MQMENYQVVVYAGALTETEEKATPEKLESLKSKSDRLAKLKAEEMNKLSTLATEMRSMNADLQHNASALIYELLALQAEEKHLMDAQIDKLFEAEPEPDDDDPFKDQVDEDGSVKEEKEEVESPQTKIKNRLDKVKKLFRKIANLTHPDKTKNPAFHELFRQAREARESLDLDMLQCILKQVISGKSSVLHMLMAKIEMLALEIQELQQQRMMVLVSDEGRMLGDWKVEANRVHVLEHYKAVVRANIDEAKQRIRGLDSTRFKPKPFNTGAAAFNMYDDDED